MIINHSHNDRASKKGEQKGEDSNLLSPRLVVAHLSVECLADSRYQFWWFANRQRSKVISKLGRIM